ncbi:E3 SUMO-protein ligase KIAA1586-like isoform X1 [Pleurodeles waltl]|uniref:E3 SUMO-protein ligase KIAA1586-like isoform X1 n=1 Tax=Pleurodeles waltl TaxID=8319 RepID=UPI0037098D6E
MLRLIATKMFKRKAVTSAESSASPQRKKCYLVFKEEWLKEIVETETQKSRSKVRVQLGELFLYNPEVGLICKVCAEAKIAGDFSTGKKWSDGWKLDYLKRHLSSKVHESALVTLRNKSTAARLGFGVRTMLTETASDRANRLEVVERQRSLPEEIKILINNVLLTVKMNTSMLYVQDVHDHVALYVKIPDSWRSKNYAFEFLEAIKSMICSDFMAELRSALHHTLIIDESTDISVTKMLVLFFKFRSITSTEHKMLFGGIVTLSTCNAEAITIAVKEFYTANKLDLMKMVMFTSDGASGMLGKNYGVATRLNQSIPHLVEKHCVVLREDLGVDDAWKKVQMIREMETLLRTVHTVFYHSPVRKSKLDEIALVTECEVVFFWLLNEVRWL